MFYQYVDSHYKDKMISRPSQLHKGNLYNWEDGLDTETGLCMHNFGNILYSANSILKQLNYYIFVL